MKTPMTREEARNCKLGTFSSVARSLKKGLPNQPVIVQYYGHDWNEVSKQREPVFLCHTNTISPQFLGMFFVGAFESLSQQPVFESPTMTPVTTATARALSSLRSTSATFTDKARELEPALPTEPVYIRYWLDAWQPKLQRHEALYHCFRTGAMTFDESDFIGVYYEGFLENFKQ